MASSSSPSAAQAAASLVNRLENELFLARNQLAEVVDECLHYEKRADRAEEECRTLRRTLESVQSSGGRSASTIVELQQENENLRKSLSTVREELYAAQDDNSKLETVTARLKKEQGELQSELDRMRKQLKQAANREFDVSEDAVRNRIERETSLLQNELENTKANLDDTRMLMREWKSKYEEMQQQTLLQRGSEGVELDKDLLNSRHLAAELDKERASAMTLKAGILAYVAQNGGSVMPSEIHDASTSDQVLNLLLKYSSGRSSGPEHVEESSTPEDSLSIVDTRQALQELEDSITKKFETILDEKRAEVKALQERNEGLELELQNVRASIDELRVSESSQQRQFESKREMEMEEIRSLLIAARDDAVVAKQREERFSVEIDELKAANEKLRQNSVNLQKLREGVVNELQHSRAEIDRLNTRVADLSERNTRLMDDYDEAQMMLKDMKGRLGSYEASQKSRDDDIIRASERMQTTMEKVENARQEMQREVSTLRAKLDASEESCRALEAEALQYQKQILEFQRSSVSAEGESEKWKEKIGTAESEWRRRFNEVQKQAFSSRQRVNELEQEVSGLKQAALEAPEQSVPTVPLAEMEELRLQFIQLDRELATTTEELRNRTSELQEAQQMAAKLQNELNAKSSSLTTVSREREQLERDMRSSRRDLLQAQESLDDVNRSSCSLQDALDKSQAESSKLQKRVDEFERHSKTEKDILTEKSVAYERLEQENYRLKEQVESLHEMQSSTFASERDHQHQQHQIDNLQLRVFELENQLKHRTERVAQLQAELQKTRTSGMFDEQTKEARSSSPREAVPDEASDDAAKNAEHARREEVIASLRSALQDAQMEIANMEERNTRLEAELEKESGANTALKAKLVSMQQSRQQRREQPAKTGNMPGRQARAKNKPEVSFDRDPLENIPASSWRMQASQMPVFRFAKYGSMDNSTVSTPNAKAAAGGKLDDSAVSTNCAGRGANSAQKRGVPGSCSNCQKYQGELARARDRVNELSQVLRTREKEIEALKQQLQGATASSRTNALPHLGASDAEEVRVLHQNIRELTFRAERAESKLKDGIRDHESKIRDLKLNADLEEDQWRSRVSQLEERLRSEMSKQKQLTSLAATIRLNQQRSQVIAEESKTVVSSLDAMRDSLNTVSEEVSRLARLVPKFMQIVKQHGRVDASLAVELSLTETMTQLVKFLQDSDVYGKLTDTRLQNRMLADENERTVQLLNQKEHDLKELREQSEWLQKEKASLEAKLSEMIRDRNEVELDLGKHEQENIELRETLRSLRKDGNKSHSVVSQLREQYDNVRSDYERILQERTDLELQLQRAQSQNEDLQQQYSELLELRK